MVSVTLRDGRTVYLQAELIRAVTQQSYGCDIAYTDKDQPYRSGDSETVVLQRITEDLASAKLDSYTAKLQGDFEAIEIEVKFGYNDDITAGEDIWSAGGAYTGFPTGSAETLTLASTSTEDQGALEDSGTATGGSRTTLVDSGAQFVTDGVTAGMCLIVDSKETHGIISAVTETQLTVYCFFGDNSISQITIESGDTYRVVSAAGSGTAVTRLEKVLDSDYNESTVYLINNGTSDVTTTGTYIRSSRGVAVYSGASLVNVGVLTLNHTTTTANVFWTIPADTGQTQVACTTVPTGKIILVDNIMTNVSRSAGAAGSAVIYFQTRRRGESWITSRIILVTDAISYSENKSSLKFDQYTDIRFRVASANGTSLRCNASFSYDIVDRP